MPQASILLPACLRRHGLGGGSRGDRAGQLKWDCRARKREMSMPISWRHTCALLGNPLTRACCCGGASGGGGRIERTNSGCVFFCRAIASFVGCQAQQNSSRNSTRQGCVAMIVLVHHQKNVVLLLLSSSRSGIKDVVLFVDRWYVTYCVHG